MPLAALVDDRDLKAAREEAVSARPLSSGEENRGPSDIEESASGKERDRVAG